MAGFHIEHFGCRAARADGEAIGDRLRHVGMQEHDPRNADVVVVNTCSVTAEADRAARAFIRKAHRDNPSAQIVVTGCYAQRAPEELARIGGVAAVVGNSHKALAPEIILGLTRGKGAAEVSPSVVPVSALLGTGTAAVWADDRFAHSFLEEAQLVPGEQTRPNLKIQEGCGNRCTFCVIPQTRGASRSLGREAILRQVDGFVAAGGNELVLSGINLGRWGFDLAASRNPTLAAAQRTHGAEGGASASSLNFAGLVREIVEQTKLPRLRLSSIEPMDWNEALIGLMREFGGTRIARHAHLPLQSGSDAVLRRMHRRYRPWHYVEKVEKLVRAAGPELTLGADVMVGFPGETDAEFEETVAIIRELPFGYLHLFPFSPRPGTTGWTLHAERPVAVRVVEERMVALRTVAAEKMREHRARLIGCELEAITLHTPKAVAELGRTSALTENFVPVELEGSFSANRLVRVHVAAVNPDGELAGAAAA